MAVKACFCPNCGGKVAPVEGKKTFFCQHCGSSLLYEDDVVRVDINMKQTIHTTDDAAIERAKSDATIGKANATSSVVKKLIGGLFKTIAIIAIMFFLLLIVMVLKMS